MYIPLMLSLLLSQLAFANTPPKAETPCGKSTVAEKVDRFTGGISITNSYTPTQDKLNPYLDAEIRPSGEWFAVLAFSAPFRQSAYLGCHDIHILVDGLPMVPFQSKYVPAAFLGGASETLVLGLEQGELSRLAQSKKLEYRICSDEGRMSESNLCELREWARLADKQIAKIPRPADDEKNSVRRVLGVEDGLSAVSDKLSKLNEKKARSIERFPVTPEKLAIAEPSTPDLLSTFLESIGAGLIALVARNN